jgi:hypothetical protein
MRWSRQFRYGLLKAWRAEKYLIRTTLDGKFHALIPDPNGSLVFVDPLTLRYASLERAQDACEIHRRNTCLSTNTPARTVATARKNLLASIKRHKQNLALSAMPVGSSSENSQCHPKHNSGASLSTKTRGERGVAVATKPARAFLEMVAHDLFDTCNSIDSALDTLGLEGEFDATDWEDWLLDVNCERCAGCGWWHDSSALVDEEDDDNTGYCEDCR